MKKLIIVLAFLLLPLTVGAIDIPEGATVKTADNPDVYIIKYNNGKQFKRLVLNPQVFESYGHLKWENVLTIDQSAMDSYTVSDFVTVYGTKDVYQLVPDGDNGSKYLATSGYDPDSVYIINEIDFRNYILQEIAKINTNISDLQNTINEQQQQINQLLNPTPAPFVAVVVTPTPTPVPVKRAIVKIGANADTQIEAYAYLRDTIDTYSKSLSRNLNKRGTNYELSPTSIARIYRLKISSITININTGFIENEPSVICTKSGNEFWSGNVSSENKNSGYGVFPASLAVDWPVIIKNYYDDYISKNPDITDVPLLFEVSCTASDGSISSDSLTVYISDSAPL